MTDPIRRAVRTAVQAFLGAIITSGVLSATATSGVVDWSALKKAGVAAAVAAVIAVVTFVQNWLEETTSLPAVLKGEKGQANLASVAWLLVILILLVIVARALGVDF